MIDVSKKTTNAVRISAEKHKAFQNGVKNILSLKEIIKKGLSQNISELAEIILGGAVILDASDIHIEPEEKEAKVRIRIDGILQDVIAINQDVYRNLLSRIKLLSELKLNISDRPQDGRFTVLISGEILESNAERISGEILESNAERISEKILESNVERISGEILESNAERISGEILESNVEIRTSTLPSEYGESIVLRILNPKSLISLEALGLRKDLYSLFKKEIKKPNGMIIVTGPTGSGKTTTLYAFLKEIHRPEIKIITIEDPIEYHLKGISQTQVAPEKKYDFASGLKSIMRQDPDVILVGEIRDLETAEIALQAALTGHLVFTTLHTNDAAGTITRLISLGAKAINIGPALNMAIAQRLVRKVCPKCLQKRVISGIDFKKIKDGISNLPKTADSPQLTATTKIPEPNLKGCNYCNFTGYKGRVGIFEAILVDDEMENFILKNPSIASLKKEMIKKGMTTMLQDGLIKVLRGVTTIEEVERVAGE